MFKKLSQLLGSDPKSDSLKGKEEVPLKNSTDKNPPISNHNNKSESTDLAVFQPLANVVSATGRITLEYLKEVAKALNQNEFIEYMKHPVLAGAGVHEGFLSSTANQSSVPNRRKKTLMFIPAKLLIEEVRKNIEAAPLKQAIFCLTKSNEAYSKDPNILKIGRENDNDLMIPDFAVSKNHAEISIEEGNYFLTDIGSSNGTLLNEQRIGSTKIMLKDKDIISFARFETTFLTPATLYNYIKNS